MQRGGNKRSKPGRHLQWWRVLIIFGAVGLGGLALAFYMAETRSTPPAVSIRFLKVMRDQPGESGALLDVKLARPAFVQIHGLEYKLGDEWVSEPVPQPLSDAFSQFFGIQAALQGNCTGIVKIPAYGPWRLTFEVIEPRKGMAGLRERLANPRGYRRAGGWLNVILNHYPVRYFGPTYYLKTEPITP